LQSVIVLQSVFVLQSVLVFAKYVCFAECVSFAHNIFFTCLCDSRKGCHFKKEVSSKVSSKFQASFTLEMKALRSLSHVSLARHSLEMNPEGTNHTLRSLLTIRYHMINMLDIHHIRY